MWLIDVKKARYLFIKIKLCHLACISDLIPYNYPKRHLCCHGAMGPRWHRASWPACHSWRDDKDAAQMTSSSTGAVRT